MQGSARIDELRQKFHENPRRYFAPLANEYRKAGDPEQAIAICRAHLAQQPAHMSGHVVYAQALYDAGRIDESRVVFEKALSLDPDNAIVLRQLGDISRQKGDSAEARHWYTRAIDADPHNREIAAYIAELTEPLTELEPEMVPDPSLAPQGEIESAPAPVDEVAAAPVEEVAAAPVEEVAAAPVEEVAAAPVEEVAAAPDEELAEPAEVEVSIPTSDEPPALTDMPGFEADDALFAADEDIELFPDSSSPFVTRTMADLYARQGYNDQALEVYRKLAADNPHDQEIADRIRELSPADETSPPKIADEPIAASDSPAPATSPDEPAHFTDTDLGAGDEWDTSAWGAGFSSEETEVVPFDFIASSDVAESTEDEALIEKPPVRPHRADASLLAETDRLGDFAAAPLPLGVLNVAHEEVRHEDYPRSAEEPEAASQPEAADEVEEAWRPEDALEAQPKALVYAEPEEPVYAQQEEESPYAESEDDSPYAEPEHFVAYSPQPPEDEDLPHYTPVGPTIREFFATLGAYRPPANRAATSFTARAAVPDIDAEPQSSESEDWTGDEDSGASQPDETQPADEFPLVSDAFANLFPDSPVSEEDSKAAFALSGALSSQPNQPVTRSYTTPQSPAPAVDATTTPTAAQESEEDIRRFREWLDGLADS